MDPLPPITTPFSGDLSITDSNATVELLCWSLPPSRPQAIPGLVCRALVDAAEADYHLRRKITAVVVVQFAQHTAHHTLRQLEQLISEHRHCAWVALLPDGWQQDNPLRALISRAFFDYHTLPPEPERLRIIIGHAFGMLALRQQVEQLTLPANEFGQILGDSPAMLRVKRGIRKVAATQRPVLIRGETGTGKELVARAIHQHSSRAAGPFEAVNCAALPGNLIQAELFGHEKGAFTDAHQRKIGRFEACHGGTLFLDEIGDMPLEQQVNLLRVLEQGCLRRIGGACDLPIDVRIIAATHINLEQAIEQGRFREDLYYRLNVLSLDLPPLREREGDIELLARYLFQRFREPGQQRPGGFSQEALEAIRHHPWPGNVRELINRVQHAVVMAEGALLLPGDLGIERREGRRRHITLEDARNEAEARAINDALHLHQHNVSEAAGALGISRVTLYRMMEKHGITRP